MSSPEAPGAVDQRARTRPGDSITPWSRRCPAAHTSVFYRPTLELSECTTCGRRWFGRPFDARYVDGFPVDPDMYVEVEK